MDVELDVHLDLAHMLRSAIYNKDHMCLYTHRGHPESQKLAHILYRYSLIPRPHPAFRQYFCGLETRLL